MFPFTFTRKATISLACDPNLPYEILTDYDFYSEWMPHVAHSKLLARERDLAIAEFEMISPPKDVFVFECIHTTNKMVLWRKLHGKVPISEIQWDIERLDGNQTRIGLAFEGKRGLPGAMRTYSRFMDSARCLKALGNQVSASLPGSLTSSDGERLLEIADTGDGLVCWFRGRKYSLTPLPEESHD
jgi:hypothetical protein